jgi:hypothetical protein
MHYGQETPLSPEKKRALGPWAWLVGGGSCSKMIFIKYEWNPANSIWIFQNFNKYSLSILRDWVCPTAPCFFPLKKLVILIRFPKHSDFWLIFHALCMLVSKTNFWVVWDKYFTPSNKMDIEHIYLYLPILLQVLTRLVLPHIIPTKFIWIFFAIKSSNLNFFLFINVYRQAWSTKLWNAEKQIGQREV